MHSAPLLVALFAGLAVASPVHLAKRYLEVFTTTSTTTVWVTAGQEPTTSSTTTSITTTTATTTPTDSTTTSLVTDVETTTPSPTAQFIEVPTTSPTPTPSPAVDDAETAARRQPQPVPVAADPAPQDNSNSGSAPQGNTNSGSAPASSGNSEIDQWTSVMNNARAKYQAGPVSWDAGLASSAAQSAATCVMKHTNTGQNIYETMSSVKISAPSPQTVADSWMSEEAAFAQAGYFGDSCSSGDCMTAGGEETGHFTQMVWKSATKFGCATQECPGSDSGYGSGGDMYIVFCNWDTGNVLGEFAQNVLPPA